MDRVCERNFIRILEEELVPALGCTEPITLAYAAATARRTLGEPCTDIDVACSGNIIKNVKSVAVPNSGGMRGVEAAAALGAAGGRADRKLEVLTDLTDDDRAAAREMLRRNICHTHLAVGVDKLYIRVCVRGESGGTAAVTIAGHHTNITRIEKDGHVLLDRPFRPGAADSRADRSRLSVRSILEFAGEVCLDDVAPLLRRQLDCNLNIARTGMNAFQSIGVASALRAEKQPLSVYDEARILAAAASEARMSGCSLPVVINSGSGNQGITVSVPVAVYARRTGADEEHLLRALIVSNLISVHLKSYIGDLSAFCGAVTAACGAGAAICFLSGGTYHEIADTVTNTLASVSGIVCDGAKPSCAAKISAALDAAFLAVEMASRHRVFPAGDGLVAGDVERTIENIGHVGRDGMESTDLEILQLMLQTTT